MKLAITGFVTAAFAAIALASAPLGAADSDEEFLAALAEGGMTIPATAQDSVVGGGRQVCNGWDAGDSYADGITEFAGELGGNRGLAEVFIRAATSTLCPEHTSELP